MNVSVIRRSGNGEYPWIGVSKNGVVVIFLSENKGFAVNAINKQLDSYKEAEFDYFIGTITLSNSH